MDFSYAPPVRWQLHDGNAWTDITDEVEEWYVEYGAWLNFEPAQVGVRQANGYLVLDNSHGQFASIGYGNGLRPVTYSVGEVVVWAGLVEPKQAQALSDSGTTTWTLRPWCWQLYRLPTAWLQTDFSLPESTPNKVVENLLTAFTDSNGRLFNRLPSGWLSGGRVDPPDWYLRYVRTRGTFSRAFNQIGFSSGSIPFEDAAGRIGLVSLAANNRGAVQLASSEQRVMVDGGSRIETRPPVSQHGLIVRGKFPSDTAGSQVTLQRTLQIPTGAHGPFLIELEYEYPRSTLHVEWGAATSTGDVTASILRVEPLPNATPGDRIFVTYNGTHAQPFTITVSGTPVTVLEDSLDFSIPVHAAAGNPDPLTHWQPTQNWVNLTATETSYAAARAWAAFFSGQRAFASLRYSLWGANRNAVPQNIGQPQEGIGQLAPGRVSRYLTGNSAPLDMMPLLIAHSGLRGHPPIVDIWGASWRPTFRGGVPPVVTPEIPDVPDTPPDVGTDTGCTEVDATFNDPEGIATCSENGPVITLSWSLGDNLIYGIVGTYTTKTGNEAGREGRNGRFAMAVHSFSTGDGDPESVTITSDNGVTGTFRRHVAYLTPISNRPASEGAASIDRMPTSIVIGGVTYRCAIFTSGSNALLSGQLAGCFLVGPDGNGLAGTLGQAVEVTSQTPAARPGAATTRLVVAAGEAFVTGAGIPQNTRIMLESTTLSTTELSCIRAGVHSILGADITFGTLLGTATANGFNRAFFGGPAANSDLECDDFDTEDIAPGPVPVPVDPPPPAAENAPPAFTVRYVKSGVGNDYVIWYRNAHAITIAADYQVAVDYNRTFIVAETSEVRAVQDSYDRESPGLLFIFGNDPADLESMTITVTGTHGIRTVTFEPPWTGFIDADIASDLAKNALTSGGVHYSPPAQIDLSP